MNSTGSKVKAIRESKVWTQQHLAEAAGLSIRTIQRIERGESFSNESILSIAAALDIDIQEIIEVREIMDDLQKVKRMINKGVIIHASLWVLFSAYLLATYPFFIERNGNLIINEVFYNSFGWGSGIIIHIALAWGRFYQITKQQ